MATPEGAITAPDVTTPPASSGTPTPTDSSSAPQGTSTPPESTASPVTTDVQGSDSQPDVLSTLPSVDELKSEGEQGIKYAAALANLRGAYEPLKSQWDELQTRWQTFEPHADRFQTPDDFQSVLNFHDGLLKWGRDPESGEPIPDTEAGVQALAQSYPQHADFITADLLGSSMVDPQTGRQLTRLDYVLENLAQDPEQRAKVSKLFGLVEPSAVAPQWQPTEDELAIVRPELQDIYRKLPYEEREELKLNSPEYINRVLQREQFTQQLQAEREEAQRVQAETAQREEQQINQQAINAGETYLGEQLQSALTTFHESGVQQAQILKPIDPQSPPQGMSPEAVQSWNQNVSDANNTIAALSTIAVVGMVNPQVRSYVVPMLQQMGIVDEKFLKAMDGAGSEFGDNGRTYGNLNFRQSRNGSNPADNVLQLRSQAERGLKRMIGYGQELRGRLIEKMGKAFEMRAMQHNQTLNSAAQVRPPLNGQGYNPTTAPAQAQLLGKMTREEINRIYG